jgi:hypothetical protein
MEVRHVGLATVPLVVLDLVVEQLENHVVDLEGAATSSDVLAVSAATRLTTEGREAG